LTPENLAAMAAMTAVWVGTQGIPVVGQAVDAALLALGVTLLSVQAISLTDSLWSYVNLSLRARSQAELDAAATHLAQAVATAGINVVAFILTKKAIRGAGPPPAAALATAEGVQFSVAVAGSTRTAMSAPVIASVGVLASSEHPLPGGNAPKEVDSQAFDAWAAQAERRPARQSADAYLYQREQAGTEELLLKGGGQQVWADGVRGRDATLLEAKYIDAPDKSPFIAGSKCHERIRTLVREEVSEEFRRYAAVIKDPRTPAVALEVITNDARAAPFFESLLKHHDIPGQVVVRP
jgi:hypothetical protein